jgi:hypothetical protein
MHFFFSASASTVTSYGRHGTFLSSTPLSFKDSQLAYLLFSAARRPYQEPEARHNLGRMSVKCRWCGALHWMNEKISDSLANTPVFGLCCDRGEVVLPMLRDPPQCLKAFLENNDRNQ